MLPEIVIRGHLDFVSRTQLDCRARTVRCDGLPLLSVDTGTAIGPVNGIRVADELVIAKIFMFKLPSCICGAMESAYVFQRR